ncbi:MAG: hypothetical protein ACTS8P_01525 [Arsenophonus sp. NC-XBC3-MAG3]
MKYYELGIAAVYNESGAYHINIHSLHNYTRQFLEHMVFERLPAVRYKTECFHIKPDRNECYPACYLWCDNFQEDLYPVRNKKSLF